MRPPLPPSPLAVVSAPSWQDELRQGLPPPSPSKGLAGAFVEPPPSPPHGSAGVSPPHFNRLQAGDRGKGGLAISGGLGFGANGGFVGGFVGGSNGGLLGGWE
mmetsp:Transcript_51470/g.142446  ORF Transcript_51470/g.142446 Transcript_51470/m.142446 type:complete len:103 (-) Transcript_51470:647-955(-)